VPPRTTPLAVALISGGLDSTVAAAWSIAEGRSVHGVSFDYGQRHRAELAAAARVAAALGLASHRVVAVDLAAIGGSALTADLAVPKGRDAAEIGRGVPVTYVPARNTVFLALALALAETLGAEEIVIGANAVDYSGYPDCRGPYLAAFEAMANLATAAAVEGRARFRVVAPLLAMSKAEIVRTGARLGAPLALTHSCYDPVGPGALACGACDSCLLRRRGFLEAGVPDPTRYAVAP
jgi:7-cyano-7-deazaguanine synthase